MRGSITEAEDVAKTVGMTVQMIETIYGHATVAASQPAIRGMERGHARRLSTCPTQPAGGPNHRLFCDQSLAPGLI